MRHKATAVLLFAMLLLLVVPASAQTVTGTLSGHVVDKTGAVVPNAKVTAVSTSTGAVRDGVSNSEGYYLITFLPLSAYDVTVTMPGFRSVKKQ